MVRNPALPRGMQASVFIATNLDGFIAGRASAPSPRGQAAEVLICVGAGMIACV
jgi:hypothetical protein